MPIIFETPFGFSLDFAFWLWLLEQPTLDTIKYIFAIGGWVVLWLLLFFMAVELWVNLRQERHTTNWQWLLLAVDVPSLMIQTPKAVEQIFAHLSGALSSINVGEKFWKGKKQKWFSLEIVSIEGYIQFLVRVEAEYRDLIEAAIYAQYVEAEITEVEDYTSILPRHYPDPTYDIFGVDFHLAENSAYPIRTYASFEYQLSKDAVFSDPMAALLENFSRIGRGENLWLQIIIEPIGNKWKEKGIELVKELVAGKGKRAHTDPWLLKLTELPKIVFQLFISILNWDFSNEGTEEKHEEQPGKMSDLTPGWRDTIAAIEEKISKIGFKSKIRILYLARKESYAPSRCVNGVIGAFNQFHMANRNAIVPHSSTKKHYAFKDYRLNQAKGVFSRAFAKRKLKTGSNPYILNIEELATIWHFPLPFVKTPLLQKAGAKRGEPPMNLPLDTIESPFKRKVKMPEAPPAPPGPVTPPADELPYA